MIKKILISSLISITAVYILILACVTLHHISYYCYLNYLNLNAHDSSLLALISVLASLGVLIGITVAVREKSDNDS